MDTSSKSSNASVGASYSRLSSNDSSSPLSNSTPNGVVLIDPLVATGYIKWASLPEMGALYLAQEKSCRAQ